MVLVTATATTHEEDIDGALRDDPNMKAMVESALANRDKKKEEWRKAVEEEKRLKKEAEEREAEKLKEGGKKEREEGRPPEAQAAALARDSRGHRG